MEKLGHKTSDHENNDASEEERSKGVRSREERSKVERRNEARNVEDKVEDDVTKEEEPSFGNHLSEVAKEQLGISNDEHSFTKMLREQSGKSKNLKLVLSKLESIRQERLHKRESSNVGRALHPAQE